MRRPSQNTLDIIRKLLARSILCRLVKRDCRSQTPLGTASAIEVVHCRTTEPERLGGGGWAARRLHKGWSMVGQSLIGSGKTRPLAVVRHPTAVRRIDPSSRPFELSCMMLLR